MYLAKRIGFSFWIKAVSLVALPFMLTACNHSNSSSNAYVADKSCAGNAFMMKFGCSLERVQREAQRGNADAQYALGYMYYYGIGTVQDRSMGAQWIQRAANQGQPLARKAMGLLASGGRVQGQGGSYGGAERSSGGGSSSGGGHGGSGSIHQAPADVAALNAKKAGAVSEQLPAYGKQGKAQPALDVLKRKSDGVMPSNVMTKPSSNSTSNANTSPSSQHPNDANESPLSQNDQGINQPPPRSKAEAVRQVAQQTAARMGKDKDSPSTAIAATKSPQEIKDGKTPVQQAQIQQEEAQAPIKNVNVAAGGGDKTDDSPVIANQEPLSSVEKQLLGITPHAYTLQLMGSHDLAAVKEFVQRHRLEGKAQYYTANYHGKEWYMLIYGDYGSVAQAGDAIKKLPVSVRTLHPWIKSYQVVQKEIKLRRIIS